MCHEYVNALGDEVPLVQQRLTSGQVKAPSIKPRGPLGETMYMVSGQQSHMSALYYFSLTHSFMIEVSVGNLELLKRMVRGVNKGYHESN